MQIENYQSVESKVSAREGSYPDLAPEALLTPIEDLKTIVNSLTQAMSWVELGSGYGLGTLLFAQTYPQKLALGIEFEFARYEESLRLKEQWGVRNAYFQHANLLECAIPEADAYFLYFPTGPVLDRVLSILGKRQTPFTLIAVESHGDLLPRLAMEQWLTVQSELPLKAQRHYPYARVYRNHALKSPSIMDLSFQDKLLLIEDDNGAQWIGESKNLEWLDEKRFNLKIPARTVNFEQVKEILDWTQVSAEVAQLLQKRRKGEDLRKIYVFPEIVIERANGSLVEWDHQATEPS